MALQLAAVSREPVICRPSEDLEQVVVTEEVVAQPRALEDLEQALLRNVASGELGLGEGLEVEPERLAIDACFWRRRAVFPVRRLVLNVDVAEALVRAVLRVLFQEAAVYEQTRRGAVQRRGHLGTQSELDQDFHIVEHTLLVAPEERTQLDSTHTGRAAARRHLEEIEDHRGDFCYLGVS